MLLQFLATLSLGNNSLVELKFQILVLLLLVTLFISLSILSLWELHALSLYLQYEQQACSFCCYLLVVVVYLSGEAAEELQEKLREGEGKVLVEEVAKESGHSMIGPATMDQQQSLQIPTDVIR